MRDGKMTSNPLHRLFDNDLSKAVKQCLIVDRVMNILRLIIALKDNIFFQAAAELALHRAQGLT